VWLGSVQQQEQGAREKSQASEISSVVKFIKKNPLRLLVLILYFLYLVTVYRLKKKFLQYNFPLLSSSATTKVAALSRIFSQNETHGVKFSQFKFSKKKNTIIISLLRKNP